MLREQVKFIISEKTRFWYR